MAVEDLDNDGSPELLLGGVNDAPEYKRATLLVFDLKRGIAGGSAGTGGQPYFQRVSPSTAKAIIYFPRTPLSSGFEYNRVSHLYADHGTITAVVTENISEQGPTIAWEFDYRLDPVRVTLGSEAIEPYRHLLGRHVPPGFPESVAEELKARIVIERAT
jgi:hypothetical protein